jgi:BolA protein
MQEQEIVERIKTLYPDASVDLAGADCSFELYVISEQFAGRNTLQRQRSILDLFRDELTSGRLHALSIKARTPAEQAGSGGLVQIQL